MTIYNQPPTDIELDEATVPVITDDPNMLGIPGVLVEMSPDEAESWGATESDPQEVEEAWKDSLLQADNN